MGESIDDRRVVSISALVAALRQEGVPDAAVHRVLAAALGVDEATARAHADGGATEPVTDIATLHTLLTDAQEQSDWALVVELIGRIVEQERDLPRRAKYLYTMATIQRVELRDVEAALESLAQTLDCDPSQRRAFEMQCALLGELQDWKRLERAHRSMIQRVRGLGDAALDFALWQGLAEIYRDRLGMASAAIEAFKMALRLRPDDPAVLTALQALGGEPG